MLSVFRTWSRIILLMLVPETQIEVLASNHFYRVNKMENIITDVVKAPTVKPQSTVSGESGAVVLLTSAGGC